ncbi:MAG: sensor histidine kinase [Propioniciclava sp.]
MSTSGTEHDIDASRRDWVIDGILAATLAAVSIIPFQPQATDDILYAAEVALSLGMVLPLALRRNAPLIMLTLATLAGILQLILVPGPTPSLIAVPIIAYSVARWVPGHASRAVVVVGAFASVLGPMRWYDGSSGTPSIDILSWGACMGAVLTPYAVGRRTREVANARAHDMRMAEERYQLLLAERDQQTRLAEASTRTMIARELHDIVAHSLSVMIVQAEGGRAVAARQPEVATEALDTIADTGREALQDLRRIVGVLRGGTIAEDRPTYAPAPTLLDIPDLVARTSDRIALRTVGEPHSVAPAVELTVYRVVQEALTNFLKHAGPDAHARVTLTHSPHSISIDVLDTGEAVPEPTEGGGNGLRGMYERVTSMGGTLRAGPREDGPGFHVAATVPIQAASPHEQRRST